MSICLYGVCQRVVFTLAHSLEVVWHGIYVFYVLNEQVLIGQYRISGANSSLDLLFDQRTKLTAVESVDLQIVMNWVLHS